MAITLYDKNRIHVSCKKHETTRYSIKIINRLFSDRYKIVYQLQSYYLCRTAALTRISSVQRSTISFGRRVQGDYRIVVQNFCSIYSIRALVKRKRIRSLRYFQVPFTLTAVTSRPMGKPQPNRTSHVLLYKRMILWPFVLHTNRRHKLEGWNISRSPVIQPPPPLRLYSSWKTKKWKKKENESISTFSVTGTYTHNMLLWSCICIYYTGASLI